MKKVIYLLMFLFVKNYAFSQTEFPIAFIGDWKGEYLQLNKPLRQNTLALQIKHADSTDKYYWKIDYDGNNNNYSPVYILTPINKNEGHWAINEKNGNVFDLYVHQNTFQMAYTRDGMTHLDNFKIENDKIVVEYFAFSLTYKKQTGLGTKEFPLIDNYFVGGCSTAILEKIK